MERKKEFQKNIKKESSTLSPKKKVVFWGITILIPFLIFTFLEITLQVMNYGGNLDLFIEGPKGYEEYKQCNPNVARRYFSSEESVPTPPLQLFRKVKKENGLRFVVLGGSSAAGFPYSSNLSFPKILESKLQLSFPNIEVEVINVAMAAVNSYTLIDLIDEVIDEQPDAILVYAGHNEYYGALGVGSVQSLGNWRWLVRAYLDLYKIKSFILLKDGIAWLRSLIGSSINSEGKADPSSTLMARVVGEQTIELDSEVFKNGKEQFSENLKIMINKAQVNNIPIITSELVSNIKDQKPFVSIDDENSKSANQFFKKGKIAEKNGNYQTAKFHYKHAKDLDALRFRGPEEFNEILLQISQQFNVPLVPLVSYFEENSENGIMGNELFLEHLHPNKEGYHIIAEAFYDIILNSNIHKLEDLKNSKGSEQMVRYTELDSVYAGLVIKHLKNGWPFKSEKTKNNFFNEFKPVNKLEEIALKIMVYKDYNLESGHMELGKYYEEKGQLKESLCEYSALISSIPQEVAFYERAATVLITQKNFDAAAELLEKSLKYKESEFAVKWIGQIALINKDFEKAIKFLSRANSNDPQVIFNLSRSYYQNMQIKEGDKYLNILAQNHPKSNYIPHLYKMKKKLETQNL